MPSFRKSKLDILKSTSRVHSGTSQWRFIKASRERKIGKGKYKVQ